MLDTFRASCRHPLHTRGAGGGGEEIQRCTEKFTDPDTLKTHLKEAHGIRPQNPGQPFPYKAKPLPSKPAVRPDRQKVTPGQEFTHKGYRFQVIGHTGPANIAMLLWTDGEDPGDKTAKLISTDPDGVRMYRITAPTEKVVKAIAAG